MPHANRSRNMHATVRVVRALERLKGLYLETPGTKLSLADAAHIAGVEPEVCNQLLSALVDVRFLARGSDGVYHRQTDLVRPTGHDLSA